MSDASNSLTIRVGLSGLASVTEGIKCPWGCKPDRYLTDVEAKQILKDVATWSGGEPQYSEIPAR